MNKRRRTRSVLALPRATRHRKSYSERTRADSRVAKVATDLLNGRIVEPKQVIRHWLLKQRVVDLDSAADDKVSPELVERMIANKELARCRRGDWWVTSVAAKRYELPKVMNREFPTPVEVAAMWPEVKPRRPVSPQLAFDLL